MTFGTFMFDIVEYITNSKISRSQDSVPSALGNIFSSQDAILRISLEEQSL